jgi:hypothetical protein
LRGPGQYIQVQEKIIVLIHKKILADF